MRHQMQAAEAGRFTSFAPPAAAQGNSAAEDARHLRRVEQLASLMDEAFRVPGTPYRVGIDGIIGLIPVLGDAVSLGTNAYVIYVADRLGVSRFTLARMLLNASVDFAVGSIPLVGDLFDIAFKSHQKNLTLLQRALQRQSVRPPTARSAPRQI